MSFLELAEKRYSCKKFDGRAVDRAQLERILEAGRLAPTAKNLQEQHIYVIESETGLAMVDQATRCRYNAGTVLAITFDKNNVFTMPGGKYDSGVEDATIVATHIILAAADEGVDSCWVNLFDPDELAKELKLPKNEQLLTLMDLGYGTSEAGPLPRHSDRKPLSETVSYL